MENANIPFSLQTQGFEQEGLYRTSPFEYPETAVSGQYLLRVGDICRVGQELVYTSGDPFPTNQKPDSST